MRHAPLDLLHFLSGLNPGPFYILPPMRDPPLNYSYNDDVYNLPDYLGLPPPFVPNNEPAHASSCAFGEDLKDRVVEVRVPFCCYVIMAGLGFRQVLPGGLPPRYRVNSVPRAKAP